MKTNIMRNMFLIALVALACAGAYTIGWAATETDLQTVTVNVPSQLSITGDGGGAFTLTSANYLSGSESGVSTVTYTILGNNIAKTALTSFVAAKISALVDGVNIQALPGIFNNAGSAGNIVNADLTPPGSYTTLGTTDTSMENKADLSASPDAKMVINGTLPISYKSVLTRDHEAINTVVTLTVTVKDA
ncbi:MAG: hypothetical protein HZC17_09690 [Candidatus Omnitrophica bacterium]|nr:hypothetical protein [Candidatus Omnitrophota bacterium]